MSDVAIFGFGSVIFMITTWATFSFGLSRMGELNKRELEQSKMVVVERDSGLTELHVERDRRSSE